MNINQDNRRAMSAHMTQEFLGITKCFGLQISRCEKPGQSFEHREIVVEQAHNKGIRVSQDELDYSQMAGGGY